MERFGIAEIFAGVQAEGKSLEEIATPLSAEVTESANGDEGGDRDAQRRIQGRMEQRTRRQSTGARRYRPGPGSGVYAPAMMSRSIFTPTAHQERTLDGEIDRIGRALDDRGVTDSQALADAVGARYWGPGRFGAALREAVAEGRVRRLSRTTYGPGDRG